LVWGAKLAAAVPSLVDKQVALRSQKLEATSFSFCLPVSSSSSVRNLHALPHELYTSGRKNSTPTHGLAHRCRAQGQDKNAAD
jgi:hypothetical protein